MRGRISGEGRRDRECSRIRMELANEKEKEARQLRSVYVEQLHRQTAQAQVAVREEQLLRQQLQADFEYNLQLMRERDSELAKYEAAVAELRTAINHLTAENSELKVSLAESECAVAQQRQQHSQTVTALHAEIEEVRHSKCEEMEGERSRCEGVRRELEQRLGEVEGDGERVRLEVTAYFEEEARRTGHQHQTQVDQLENAVLQSQSEVKRVCRELEGVKYRLQATQEEAQGLRDRAAELERQMRAQEWAWQGRLVVCEAELGEVRVQLEHTLTTLSSSEDHFQHKYSELDRQAREKTLCLQAAKERWVEREAELECQVREVEEECVRVERERREERESVAEQLKKNDLLIERLESELQERGRREAEREREVEQQQTDTHSQLVHEREKTAALQATLDSMTSDLQKAEQAVRECVQREGVLEREGRERVREAERRASSRTQTALRTLAQERDKVLSELGALKEELSQQQKALDDVARERDVAITTLKTHSLYQHFLNHLAEVKGHVTQSSGPHDLMSHDMLSQQNQQLKSVIASMRKDMEHLSLQSPNEDCSRGYIQYLESELVSVKTENRRLRAEGVRGMGGNKPPHSPQPSGAAKLPYSRHSHLLVLSEAIAVLQKEKTALELRVVWLQHSLAATQASLKAKEEEVFQLKAVQVPPHKCQKKLLLATRSIISLLRERDSLLASQEGRRRRRATEGGEEDPLGGRQWESEGREDPQGGDKGREGGLQGSRGKGCERGDLCNVQDHRNPVGQTETGLTTQLLLAHSTPPQSPTSTTTHPHQTHDLPQQQQDFPEPSLCSLYFSDSEVERPKSLEKCLLLTDDCLLSTSPEKQTHPHTSPDSPNQKAHLHTSPDSLDHQAHLHTSLPPPDPHLQPASQIASVLDHKSISETAEGGVVAIEMHGRSAVRHVKPIQRKPHGVVVRSHRSAAASCRVQGRNYNAMTN